MFYKKIYLMFFFVCGFLGIFNFVFKGCYFKVYIKYYFLLKYLFVVVIVKLLFMEYNIVNVIYS